MQPGKNSDDIHTILSRFNNWSGKQNGDTVQILNDEVREIPYDEAMRRVRNRVRARDAATPATKPVERVKNAPAIAPVDTALPVPASCDATATPAVAETAEPDRTARQPEETAVRTLPEAPILRAAHAKKAAKKAHPKTAPKAKPRTAALVAAAPAKKTVARVAAAKTAPVRKKGPAINALAPTPVSAKPEEFRQVLAKSVRQHQTAARSAKANPVERRERVSVPLSSGEKVRLRQCAAIAGVSVPVYLRMRALGMELPRSEPQVSVPSESPQALAQAVPVEENQAHSGFGDWITLLRNRFLASPARFAERA